MDGVLLQMTMGTNTLRFTYAVDGTPCSVNYNGTEYYYVTNQQGDVTAILDGSGNAVTLYTYDAWGKLLSSSGSQNYAVGLHNPLRYRGYVYDTETGLYYLQSRYYDPEVGRFINADGISNLGANGKLLSFNLFIYCGNNPVMGFDPTGCWDWGLFCKVLITTVVVAACLTGVGCVAAAAATVTATSVSAAVTTAVATAVVSTTMSAIDGAVCAEQSGGEWYDGFMAGAMGGSAGALVSSFTRPTSGSDTILRMNCLGRTTSSLVYDVSYKLLDTGTLQPSDFAEAMVDVTMDIVICPVTYYYSDSINNQYAQSFVNGLVDGVVDVFQTDTLFTP